MAVKAKNKQFWTEFIDTYHSLPSLWNTKDEHYNNRDIRTMAWNKLVEKLQELEPDVNQGSVKRKINTFRSNFNREVRKIRQTQREQKAEPYNPTLWYFDHLSFLLDQENIGIAMEDAYKDVKISLMDISMEEPYKNGHISTKREIQENETTFETLNHNDDFENSSNNDNETTVKDTLIPSAVIKNKLARSSFVKEEETLLEFTTITDEENVSNTEDIIINSPLPSSNDSEICNSPQKEIHEDLKNQPNRKVMRDSFRKKSKLRFEPNKPYVRNHLKNNKMRSIDEADIYGQSWACGFRKLTSEQKLYAKKAIDEILLLGQLNSLKLHTVPMNYP